MKLQDWFIEKDYGLGLALLGTFCKNRIMLQSLSRKPNPEKLEYELRKIAKEQGIIIGTTEKIDETNGLSKDHTNVSPVENTEAHSDQVIDLMNADKLKQLESGADEIVYDKLYGLESDAYDIVSDKVAEFETQVDEILAGKLEVVRDGRKVKFEDLSPEMQARWTQNKDAYKEIRALHEKLKLMENATPEDRQPLTQRICDLDDMIRDNWAEIDAYVPAPAGSVTDAPVIDHKRIGANRKFISTNLKKLPAQQDPVKAAKVVAEIQKRYDELKAAGEAVDQDTIVKMKNVGVKC